MRISSRLRVESPGHAPFESVSHAPSPLDRIAIWQHKQPEGEGGGVIGAGDEEEEGGEGKDIMMMLIMVMVMIMKRVMVSEYDDGNI